MNLPIVVGKSIKLKGIRGIFASRNILKNELIESCPIILIPEKELNPMEKTVLGNYKYAWNTKYDCIVLGYCMLTNHSYNPNTIYKRDFRKKKMNFYAIKNIKRGEEIYINYNGDPENKDPLEKEYTDYKL
jgi:uncharacterized protein